VKTEDRRQNSGIRNQKPRTPNLKLQTRTVNSVAMTGRHCWPIRWRASAQSAPTQSQDPELRTIRFKDVLRGHRGHRAVILLFFQCRPDSGVQVCLYLKNHEREKGSHGGHGVEKSSHRALLHYNNITICYAVIKTSFVR